MNTLNPSKLFPLIVTERFDEMKAFYVDKLGAHLTFDLPNYLQVRFGEAVAAPELAFMRFGGPAPGPSAAFSGGGVVVSIPVENADAHADQLAQKGVSVSEVEDRPWEWRSFYLVDPAGVVLDFFHPIEAK